MKYLPLILLLTGCASNYRQRQEFLTELSACAYEQTRLYGDLCAESRECEDVDKRGHCSNRAADKRGFDTIVIEANYDGVRCASQSIVWCMGGYNTEVKHE